MYPVLISLGPVEIYTYGVFLALAFYFSVQWAVKIGTRRGFDEEMILNLAVVSILSAIFGARATYVTFTGINFSPTAIGIFLRFGKVVWSFMVGS